MEKRISIKQKMRDKVDKLLEHEEFIPWNKLGICFKDRKSSLVTDEAKIVFDYMEELRIPYRHYRDIYPDGKLFNNIGGFHNPIPIVKTRKKKLQRLIEKYEN